MAIVSAKRIVKPGRLEFAPMTAHSHLCAAIDRLFASLDAFVKCAVVRIEIVETNARQQIEFNRTFVEDMHAGRRAAGKNVLSVVQEQRDQIDRPVVDVVGRLIDIPPDMQCATERRAAGRPVGKSKVGYLLSGKRRCRDDQATGKCCFCQQVVNVVDKVNLTGCSVAISSRWVLRERRVCATTLTIR